LQCGPAVKLYGADCIANRIRLTVPQPPEWQPIGNQIDAAFIFAWANFVNVFNLAQLDAGAERHNVLWLSYGAPKAAACLDPLPY
jgi:hypothetical protein